MAVDSGTRRRARRRLGRLGSVLILLLALGSASCAREPGDSFIGLIVLDAARPDRFSTYGYGRRTTPEIDRLGAEGTVFLNHFSQHTSTRGSVPKMLFSRYYTPPIFPTSARVPLSSPLDLFRSTDPESASLPRLLARSGYHTLLVSAHAWIRTDTPMAAEFDEIRDLWSALDYPPERAYPDAGMVIDDLIDWLDAEARRHRRLFVYLHLMDTHFPHYVDADAERFLEEAGHAAEEVGYDRERFVDEQWRYFDSKEPLSERDRILVDAVYDGSLRFTDRELGRLFRRLREGGDHERTLVALTADHGELLGEVPGRFGHGGPWYDLVARVPLILSGDGVPAGRFEPLSEHVDLNPTLLAAAGVAVPEGVEFDGVDLLAVARGDAPVKEYAMAPGAIRDRRYKAIVRRVPRGGRDRAEGEGSRWKGRLYDLESDPLEVENVWRSEPLVAKRMAGTYSSRMRRPFRRYLSTHANEQPRSPFAIGANHFDVSGASSPSPAVDPASLWHLETEWQDFHLALDPGGAVDVRFRIPDGDYRLSVSFAGEGTVGVGGGALEVALTGPPPALELGAHKMRKKTVRLGEITIADERFHARVESVEGGEGIVVRYFGFEPLGSGVTRSEADLEAEERLRSLGYIE